MTIPPLRGEDIVNADWVAFFIEDEVSVLVGLVAASVPVVVAVEVGIILVIESFLVDQYVLDIRV